MNIAVGFSLRHSKCCLFLFKLVVALLPPKHLSVKLFAWRLDPCSSLYATSIITIKSLADSSFTLDGRSRVRQLCA